VIARVPIPQTPHDIAAQWGSDGAASIARQSDPDRDALIAQLAQTADVYEARDLLAQIEATIVRAAVALPITGGPALTIVDRDVTGVVPRNGAVAPLTSGVSQWAAVK
jgi:peptide/nickel transport system substrate-binding protein